MAMPKIHESPTFIFSSQWLSGAENYYTICHKKTSFYIALFSSATGCFEFENTGFNLNSSEVEELARHGTFLHELYKHQSNEQTNQKKAT